MRPLAEIIEAVQAGESPEYDELFYAVSALQHLVNFDGTDLVGLAERGSPEVIKMLEEHCKRVRGALSRPPILWIGPNDDPRNPEFQERRLDQLAARTRIVH